MSCVISRTTAHHFTNELIKDVRKTNGLALKFDRTTIDGVCKQLDSFFDMHQRRRGLYVRF